MATQSTQVIETVTVRGVSEGLDKVASDLDKVSAAQGRLAEAGEATAKVSEIVVTRQLDVGKAFAQVVGKIDPAFQAQQQMARGQAVFDRALGQGKISADEYARRLEQLQAKYGTLGVANNNLVGQTGNLAAQFNDIAVQLAGGQSPFLIALQQGSQITQVIGDKGAKGAVQALSGAFMSLLNPVSIATIAIIGLGGSLIQYIANGGSQVESLDDKLKRHADLIRGLKDAYGEAAKGLDDYAAQSRMVSETQLRADQKRLTDEIQNQGRSLAAAMSTAQPAFTDPASGAGFGGVSFDTILPKFKAFEDALRQLNESAANGQPNIRAFRDAVAEVAAAAAGDQKIQELAAELLRLSDNALKVEQGLTGNARAMRLIANAAADGIGDIKAFGDALKALDAIGLPDATNQQKALLEYRKAIDAAGGREERDAARARYEAALQRSGERDSEKRNADFERSLTTAQGRTRQIEEETRLLGIYGGALEAARLRIELETEAKKKGLTIGDEVRASIEREVEARRAAVEQLEAARRIQDLRQDIADTGKDALKGFISDLRAGKSAAEAFENALNRVLDRLLDMMLNSLFDQRGGGFNPLALLFGGGAGGAGGAGGGTGFAAPLGTAINASFSGSLVPALTKAVTSATTTAVDASRGAVEQYVRMAATQRGIDPDIAARVVKQESSFNPGAIGDDGKSFGPMQLYTGGGLGNEALRRGISLDPSNWRQQVDFGMDVVKQDGWRQWYGARDIGVGRWDGIDRGFTGLGRTPPVETAPLQDAVAQATDSIGKLGSETGSVAGQIASAVPNLSNSFTTATQAVGAGGAGVGDALNAGAQTIGQGADGVGSALTKLIKSLDSDGGGFGGLLKGLVGGGGSSFQGFDLGDVTLGGGWTFANGGIMTARGALPLNAYANGGIADRPQLAMFGEGRTPEAYVPLPDGRSIPVSMRGMAAPANVNVRVINNGQPMQASVGSQTRNADGSVNIDVILDAAEARMAGNIAAGRGPLKSATGARPALRG